MLQEASALAVAVRIVLHLLVLARDGGGIRLIITIKIHPSPVVSHDLWGGHMTILRFADLACACACMHAP